MSICCGSIAAVSLLSCLVKSNFHLFLQATALSCINIARGQYCSVIVVCNEDTSIHSAICVHVYRVFGGSLDSLVF